MNKLLNNIFDIIIFFLLIIFSIFFLIKSTESLGYNWQWYRVNEYLYTYSNGHLTIGVLIKALFMTLKISFLSLIFAIVIGTATAILKNSDSFVGKIVANFYIETIRNTPLLIQIFVFYFVIAPVFNINQFFSAVFSLAFFEGAYIAEIIRGGIKSIHSAQWESSFSLGLNKVQTYVYVIFPQVIKNILPTLTSQSISLIKDSALVSTIAVYELTMETQRLISETFLTFELWFTTAIIYLFVTLCLQLIAKVMEINFKKGS